MARSARLQQLRRAGRGVAAALALAALSVSATACDDGAPGDAQAPSMQPAADRSVGSSTSSPSPSTSSPATSTPSSTTPSTSTSSTSTSSTIAGASPSTTAPAATIGPEQVARAQRLFLAQGYAIGEVDGEIGPATAGAIRDLQAATGLPATGQLDARTISALERRAAPVAQRLPASVTVDLSEQRLYVFSSSGAAVTDWPVSTGGPGNETPTGAFNVQARQRVGTAAVETVHMDFFTVFNGNVGFHGIPWVVTRDDRLWTPLGEYGVSHGCIRMEDANAEYLYTFLADGAPVTVQD